MCVIMGDNLQLRVSEELDTHRDAFDCQFRDSGHPLKADRTTQASASQFSNHSCPVAALGIETRPPTPYIGYAKQVLPRRLFGRAHRTLSRKLESPRRLLFVFWDTLPEKPIRLA